MTTHLITNLYATLGPEPLSDEFNADYLFDIVKRKKQPIKSTIMDSHIVVGVGNIYASESLFLCIHQTSTSISKD